MSWGENNIVVRAIRHRKLIYAIVISLIGVGVVGLLNMNRDEFPTFVLNQGLVAAVYPGATAEEVDEQVAKPLEEVLFSFQEVDRASLKTVSKDGICYLYVDLTTPERLKDQVWSKIKLKLNTAKLTLPSGVLAVVVLDDFSETSALLIAMESDDKGYSEMRRYADDLCVRLRAIPTLAKASVLGIQEEEIAVTVDQDRLASYGISPASLMLKYQSATLKTSGGTFDTDYAKAPIHITNPVSSEAEIEDYIVYSDPSGSVLRLSDVATVERRLKPDQPGASFNGHNTLIINVSMRPDHNIVKFGKEVDKVLAEFSARMPDSVHMSRITDQPKVVKSSVMGFLRDLLISMLVVILVMLMLFPMRSALIAGSGVPVCTAVTIAIMFITGMPLNTVTLAALIVVLGMIVDDSIITMDGYMVKLGKYGNRTEAAWRSANELIMPMFLATFAISAMFFPCKHIITGYLGFFIKLFPWVIAIALGCSLAYALFVVPSLEVRFISGKNTAETWGSRIQNKFFDGMQRLYDKGEALCFRHPAITIGIGVAAIALGVLMFLQINIQMMPKASRECFTVEMVLDNNSSIEDTRELSDSLSGILLKDSRVKSVTAFTGESAPRFHATYAPSLPGPNVSQLIVNTVSRKATQELISEYENRYEHFFPNAIINFHQMSYQPGGEIEIAFKGADTRELKPLADSLKHFLFGMDDKLKFIHSDCDDFLPLVNVEIIPEEASRLGVDKTLLSLSLQGILDGSNIANIYEEGVKIPVNVYNSGISDTMDYSDLGDQLVPTLTPGVSVPLSQVATLSPEWRTEKISRIGGEESVSVYASMTTDSSQPAAMKVIDAYIKKNIEPVLPEGAYIKYLGLNASNDMVFPEIAWSFLAAVSVLFLFLLLHFRKVSIAVLTMVLSTLCLFGASFGLWIFDKDFSMTAVLGLISLVGIIVRNGIIMFEYAEDLQYNQGYSVKDAAMLAGQRRMRPIFLTSCTTALGVLPMILSNDQLWMPMGLVICFGTMLSIGLVVLVMPVSYWQVFKKSKRKDA